MPAASKPHGRLTAGLPVRLNGMVYGYHDARMFSTNWLSISIGPKKS